MQIKDFKAKYFSGNATVKLAHYTNGRKALVLVEAGSGKGIFTATTNLPDQPLAANEVFLKDWSENQGVTEELVRAGVVGPELRRVKTGFVEATVHKILCAEFLE